MYRVALQVEHRLFGQAYSQECFSLGVAVELRRTAEGLGRTWIEVYTGAAWETVSEDTIERQLEEIARANRAATMGGRYTLEQVERADYERDCAKDES